MGHKRADGAGRAVALAVLIVGVLAGALVPSCGGSGSNGCPNCAKMVACCLAEADAGAPMGGKCVNNSGEVNSRITQNSACNSDPSLVQGDADRTCKEEFSGESSLPNAPSACTF
jgi:hypothetical protein